jgi:hypothetical protein
MDMNDALQLAFCVHNKEGGNFPSLHEIQGFGGQLLPGDGHGISCHGVRRFQVQSSIAFPLE